MLFKKLLAALFGSALALAAAIDAPAQDVWPSRPIKIIVPFPAGGSSDPPMRVLAAKLQEALGQSVVIEHISGGGGGLATARLAQSSPDGYTLAMAAVGTLCIVPHLYSKVGYDPVKSFSPISLLGEYTNVLVVGVDQPYKTVADLIKAARDHPGAINFGSSGNGSSNHLSAELLASMAGVKFTHVPYRGTGPAMTDLLAGRLSFMFDVTNNSLPYIQSGKLRALAVTSPTGVPQLPGVPPVAQTNPGYEVLGWIGLIAPAGTPPAVVEKLSAAVEKALQMPDLVAQYAVYGFDAKALKPDQFAALIKKDFDKWGPIVKASGAKIDCSSQEVRKKHAAQAGSTECVISNRWTR